MCGNGACCLLFFISLKLITFKVLTEMERVESKFGVKIVCLGTDNASNMVSMRSIIKEERPGVRFNEMFYFFNILKMLI